MYNLKNKSIFLFILAGVVFLASCQPAATSTPSPAAVTQETPGGPRQLNVITHDSFAVSEEVVAAFETQYNARVQFIKGGDTGVALNKLILSKDHPLADVFYGLDNTYLSRALDEGIFEPYASPLLAQIPVEFQLDPAQGALPVDYGDVCINYDKAYFAEKNLTPPQDLDALLDPQYRSMLVVENPATSSPGLAFLLATIGRYGEEGYLDYWRQLVDNDVQVVNDWETAYNGEFSYWGGTRPLVVSYSSSPPFEMIFAETPLEEPPTGSVVGPGSCFRQIEFAGILKGTPNRDLAEAWIDFMLSPTFQEDMPMQMAVFPVNPDARLDESFAQYLQTPEQPATLAPDLIASQRETWIQAWTEVVLR